MLDTPVPSQDGSRRLKCVIEGECIVFSVTVGRDWVVGKLNLKKEIKEERAQGVLKNVIKLTWRAILTYWPDQPPTTHLHIIVKIPATGE